MYHGRSVHWLYVESTHRMYRGRWVDLDHTSCWCRSTTGAACAKVYTSTLARSLHDYCCNHVSFYGCFLRETALGWLLSHIKPPMNALLAHLDSLASCVQIDLTDPWWYSRWDIKRQPGWYFIRTDAPIEVLQRQQPWCETYFTKRARETRTTKNYNLAQRAARFTEDMRAYWNIHEVYSGMASSLADRAREHTFPDPGTAGLALGKYPELAAYNWTFGFIRLERFNAVPSGQDMLLRLGEQVWRAKNGWPLLCSE